MPPSAASSSRSRASIFFTAGISCEPEACAICAERVTTYHVEDATAIDPEHGTIRHKPIGRTDESERAEWLAKSGPVRVGMTAGASTPNNKIGDAVARILATRGIDPSTVA